MLDGFGIELKYALNFWVLLIEREVSKTCARWGDRALGFDG
jgi:hypothetical protein